VPGDRHAVFIAGDAPPPASDLQSPFASGSAVSEAGGRLDLFVAGRAGLSRTQAATLIATGHVSVNGRAEKASYRLRVGDRVEVTQPPRAGRDVLAEAIPLRVAFEDEWLLVIDKPAGMVVHPAPGHWSGTLVNALLGRLTPEDIPDVGSGGPGRPRPYQEPGETGSPEEGRAAGQPATPQERAGLVHRLDKDTSGLLLVAKTADVHRRLSAALAQRRIRRLYAVLSWGHLSRDRLTVEGPIGRDPRDRKRMAIVTTGRSARTDFLRLARFDSADLLRARLSSGRTHQIRVHLASVGHPVVGDDTYGGKGRRTPAALPPHRHFLHAAWLMLEHPVTRQLLDLRSPLPPDLRGALAAVGGDALGRVGATVEDGDSKGEGDVLDHVGFYRTDHPDH
jgi:23S rRNA pseudouridine1911/1915/1917 synthase